MKLSGIGSKWNEGSPGEPLFTLQDMAVKLGITVNSLAAYMKHHPGLEPFCTRVRRGASDNAIGYYKMGDFKKWWRSFERKQ